MHYKEMGSTDFMLTQNKDAVDIVTMVCKNLNNFMSEKHLMC